MAFPQPASLELRLRTIKWAVTAVFATFNTCETIRPGKHLINLFSIVRPVGRNVQLTVIGQALGNTLLSGALAVLFGTAISLIGNNGVPVTRSKM